MLRLLGTFSWQELRHHPWRTGAAVSAVAMGVALAFAVHLINASALSEFSSALRTLDGQSDLQLRASGTTMDEALYARIAVHKDVTLASPVLQVQTYALDTQGRRQALKVLGVDALRVAGIAPALMPRPWPASGLPPALAAADSRLVLFAPNTAFLNPLAQGFLASQAIGVTSSLRIFHGQGSTAVHIAGQVAASAAALAVMDIGAAQELFGLQGQISRIDLRLQSGTDHAAFIDSLQLGADVQALTIDDTHHQMGNLSRAYRVNMTVLALVALFTGAFLVFSVFSLSVAKRASQFALLGVLGLTARQRLHLVLAEAAALGLLGSLAGLALGTALAALGLRLLGGDLGGGYFSGMTPPLQWRSAFAALYLGLGVAAALVGAWWPARSAQALPLAQTLKGLGGAVQRDKSWLFAIILIAIGALLTVLPAIFGIPLGAYAAVALLLVGAIALLPWLVAGVYQGISPVVAHRLLPLLATARARHVPQTAAVAVSGVVAALSLAVALTVMVVSFRQSVTQWLDVVLPAPLYLRSAGSVGAGQTIFLPPGIVSSVRALPGVASVAGLRVQNLQRSPGLPAVTLIARPLDTPARSLPLVAGPVPRATGVSADALPIYVSEAMVDLHSAVLGQIFTLNIPKTPVKYAQAAPKFIADSIPTFYVAGVWRDYARQFGTIAIDHALYVQLSGDERLNDLAIWLQEGANPLAVQEQVRKLADSQALEFTSAQEIRALSLRIFDRSFAITYWLQAVAIAMGLFGVAASFSAQVLSRRKELGLLAHLGFTKKQILMLVALEGIAWTAIGSIAGCVLGLVIASVLVHVVNPQSFHWTMDLAIPWLRLAALCGAVVVVGTLTAWLAGRSAASHEAVMAVKEDW